MTGPGRCYNQLQRESVHTFCVLKGMYKWMEAGFSIRGVEKPIGLSQTGPEERDYKN